MNSTGNSVTIEGVWGRDQESSLNNGGRLRLIMLILFLFSWSLFASGETETQSPGNTNDLFTNSGDGNSPGTLEQTRELISSVQDRVDYAKSQVDRYRRHQWGGLNRSRRRRYKRWVRTHKEGLDILLDLMNHASSLESGSGNSNGDNSSSADTSQVASLEIQRGEATALLQTLNDAGVEDSPLTEAELGGLPNSKSYSSNNPSGSAFGQGGASLDFQDTSTGAVENDRSQRGAGSGTNGAHGDGGYGSSGGSGGSRGVAGSGGSGQSGGSGEVTSQETTGSGGLGQRGGIEKMTTQEANGYKINFKGEAIGISGASIFGIVQQEYRQQDKKRTFFLSER